MSDSAAHQATFRARRKDAGAKKLSFYLTAEEAALLAKLKSRHGTEVAAVRAALRVAATT